MRTKTLLLTAAIAAASVVSSMAQVYSVNAVGYVNLTNRPGFNLIANQFKKLGSPAANHLNLVLPGVPQESLVQKYVGGSYSTDIYIDLGNPGDPIWYDNASLLPSTTTISPGEGLFFFNPLVGVNVVTTLTGDVLETSNDGAGPMTIALPPGFTLAGAVIPQTQSLRGTNGFVEVQETLYQTFNAATQTYNEQLIFIDLGNPGDPQWYNNVSLAVEDARPDVGVGFFLFNPLVGMNMDWIRVFEL